MTERENGRKKIKRFGRCETRRWVYRCPYSLSENGRWPVRVWPYVRRDQESLTLGIGAIGGKVADAHVELKIWR